MGSRRSKATAQSNSSAKSDYVDWTKKGGEKALNELDRVYDQSRKASVLPVSAGNAVKGPAEESSGVSTPAVQAQPPRIPRIIERFHPETEAAIGAIGRNAGEAEHTATDIHDMVGQSVNPYFKESLTNALKNLGSRLSNNAAYGGYGTSDTGRIIGREMGSALTGALNDQWNATQQRRLQANALEQQAYQGLGALQNSRMNASGKRDLLQQAQLDAANTQQYEDKMADWQNLGRYIEGLNAIRAGTGQGTAIGSGITETKTPFNVMDAAQAGASIAPLFL